MPRPALLLSLLLASASCGANVTGAPSSSSTGGGGHATTSTTSTTGAGGAGGAGAAGGAPSWCTPIPPGSPTGSGFTPAWATPVGEAPPEEGPMGITVDAQGNVIFIGSFLGSLDLGTGTVLSAPKDEYDGYIAALSPAGHPLWLSEATLLPYQVVAGGTETWVSSVLSDFSLARFDSAGQPTWSWPVHPYDAPAIAPDDDGGLWVADSFVPPSFDYGIGSLPPGGGSIDDVALLRFDASGALLSARSLGAVLWPSPPAGDHSVYLKAMARAPDGGVLVVAEILTQDEDELAILHLNASGGLVWIERFAPSSGAEDPLFAADPAGNMLIVAQGNGEATYDLGCGTASPAGEGLVYVSADGTPRWWRSWDQDVDFLAVGLDPAGNVLLAGRQYGPVDLGGGALPWPDGATSRVVVLKLSPSGAHLASRSFGDGPDQPSIGAGAVAVTPDGALLFTGVYTGTPDLGPLSSPLPTATSPTAFVAKLVP